MTRWQYGTLYGSCHDPKQTAIFAEDLNKWGAEGWELIAVAPRPESFSLMAILKRACPDAGPPHRDHDVTREGDTPAP